MAIGVSVVYAVGGVLMVRRALHGRVSGSHNAAIGTIYHATGTIFAVLLGFFVVLAWQRYDTVKTNASQEAAVLTSTYRQTEGMPKSEQTTMRRYLTQYTEAVIT